MPDSKSIRWIAPVLAAGVVAAGVALPRMADASSALEKLPDVSASTLLADVATAEVDGMSGTVVGTSRLGLPALPTTGAGGGGAVSLNTLLSGSTTARVWSAGEDKQRIAVDAPFAEYDVVRSGTDLYTYDSASTDVTHVTLPAGQEKAPTPGAVTPKSAADQVLAMVTPSTDVAVGTSAMVADRAAYELVLTPRDAGTLVGSVRLAVDGATKEPLRVQVFAKGQAEPAVEVGYTAVRFAVPDDSVFAFTPPAGSTVKEKDLSTMPQAGFAPKQRAPQAGPTVLGEDWTSVVVTKGAVPAEQEALVAQLSKPVDGGRVVTSALMTVLFTDDGRVLAGAVPTATLVELAK